MFIGLISYSLYLWHWPLFAFTTYWSLEGIPVIVRVALVLIGFVIAVASWHYIETPFRLKRLGASRRMMYAQASAGISTVACCGMLIWTNLGFPDRFSSQVLALAATTDEPRSPKITYEDALQGRFLRLGNLPTSAPVQVFLWGDSHAHALIPALKSICDELNVVAEVATHSATAPVLEFPQQLRTGLTGERSIDWADHILQHIEQQKIPHVVLAARWSGHLGIENIAQYGVFQNRHLADALLETVRRLNAAGSQVWVVGEVPTQSAAVPKALALNAIIPQLPAISGTTVQAHAEHTQAFRSVLPRLKAAGAKLIDVSECLYDSSTGTYKIKNGTFSLYTDRHHLSRAGSLYAREAFRPVFDACHTDSNGQSSSAALDSVYQSTSLSRSDTADARQGVSATAGRDTE